MELRLSEELLLVALNEKTGTFAPFKPWLFKYTLAAAILQELTVRKKLEVDGEKLKVIDADPTGDSVLDTALEIVAKSAKHKKIQHWVSKVSGKCNIRPPDFTIKKYHEMS